jgi:hypothetical protein
MNDPLKESPQAIPDEEDLEEDAEPGTDAGVLLERVQERGRAARQSMATAVARTERAARKSQSYQNLRISLPTVGTLVPSET